MGKVKVEFEHQIGDRVHVADYPDVKARVVGLCERVYGATYCVCWWSDGNRREEWVHGWEIKACGKK